MTPFPSTGPRSRPSFKPIGDYDPDRCHEVLAAIWHQLPEGVRDRVAVEVTTDAYFLATHATFTTQDGREFKTRLGSMLLSNGKPACVKVPEFFLAEMCLML